MTNSTTKDTNTGPKLRASASERSESTSKNGFDLGNRDWVKIGSRTFFMVLFALAAFFAFYVAIVLVFIQLLVTIIQDEANETLKEWISQLANYLKSVMDYLSMKTEARPFPLDDKDG